jgi:SAM-dependent methyltransferase
MNGLKFTDEVAWQLEQVYLTKDVSAQRSETVRQLALSDGERVLDIGSGPGFLCERIAEIVGRDGAVKGIDLSSDFVARCKQRNPPEWLSYEVGDATQLALPDASFDVVVSTQVVEYIPDVNRALSEAFRVLRRGGRALFLATDWEAIVWHSEALDRMAMVLKSWEAHCAHPHLPRSLGNRLISTGFRLDGASVFPILNLQWDDAAYSKGLAGLVRNFVERKQEIAPDDLREWYNEFSRLSEAGAYFFSANRYIFRVSKPNI